MSNLCLDHIKDLKKSGLNDETITAANIESIPPTALEIELGMTRITSTVPIGYRSMIHTHALSYSIHPVRHLPSGQSTSRKKVRQTDYTFHWAFLKSISRAKRFSISLRAKRKP